MADPPNFSLFHQIFLTGDKPLLTLDDDFLRNHTKVLLRSDASGKTWEVKLDGNKLAAGWEDFAAAHLFGDGDVLVFRHDGDENFHVAVSSRSDSGDIQHASLSCVDTDDTEIDDDDVEYDDSDDGDEDDDDDDDEDVGDDGGEDVGDILVNKNKKAEADSSSGDSCFLTARVTPYSLFKDRLDLSRDFTGMSFDEQKKTNEIDLVNEKGRKWTLLLSRNSSSGVFYIRRGWVSFCSGNELSQGDICKFKISENGERHVLLLCPQESGDGHEEEGEEKECPEADAVKISSVGGCSKEKSMLDEAPTGKEKKSPSPFLKLKLTPSRLKTGQLYISSVFLTENGINKPGEIVLMNKDGSKWPSYLRMTGQYKKEWFYLRKGWREMCEVNGVKVYDKFVLKLIWEDANPILKFYSKYENKGAGNARTRKKRACESALQDIEGQRVSRRAERHDDDEKRGRTRVSNRPASNSRKLQRTQPESCSVSDQVANVKRSIVDTLNTIRQFRADLETREGNLEASLLEIDALGERIWGISQILNNKLV